MGGKSSAYESVLMVETDLYRDLGVKTNLGVSGDDIGSTRNPPLTLRVNVNILVKHLPDLLPAVLDAREARDVLGHNLLERGPRDTLQFLVAVVDVAGLADLGRGREGQRDKGDDGGCLHG